MNKVSIVGHPACGLHRVEGLLRQCGMQPPLPSRRDGMTPHDIAQTLIKAHQCEPVESTTDESALAPIHAGAVWHGMALDLLLGNLDQSFWGWADPSSIYLLDYWRTLDPQMVFVLVYDHPRSALKKWASSASCDVGAIDLRTPLDNWSAYNGAMLRFYLRHPECCVLVSAEQMHHTVDAYLQQMGHKLRRPLSLGQPVAALDLGETQTLPTPLQATANLLGASPADLTTLWQVPEVEEYLIDDVLQRHPAALQLHEEMQSAASLPPVKRAHMGPGAEPAWQAFLRHRNAVASTLAHLLEVHERSAAQVKDLLEKAQNTQNIQRLEQQQHEQTKHAAAQLEQDKAQLTGEIQSLRRQLEQKRLEAAGQSQQHTAAVAELKEENDLLLNQLHQVQEELERQFVAKTGLHSQVESLQTERGALQQANAELQATRHKLEQALKATATQADQHSAAVAELKEENDLLLNQLHQVQEELERYYLDNQKLKAAAKPAKPRHYGAADRIRQQLTYRLGARVIQQHQTFWGKVWLLPALWNEARAFKREQAQRANHKLPPLHQYADAYEAERVKQHLSYRLGQVVRRAGYNPLKWPMLPFALQHEATAWKREQGKA